MQLIRLLAFVAGLVLIFATLRSVIRTFVLPRSANDRLTRAVFLSTRRLFNIFTEGATSYAERDRLMAYYAPVSLLALLPVYLAIIMCGYAGVYYAFGVEDVFEAFKVSGSSLLTLGIAQAAGSGPTIVIFSEATLGLIMVALLIAYLPTMYASFSRRESTVTMLEVRAGSPPSAVEMLLRYQRIHGLGQLGDVWRTWEVWFAELEETHSSLPALAFFRSPQPEHSWITAAGAILDAAAITNAVVDLPHDAQADLCLRAGYLALRHIADFFLMDYERSPKPTDPISVSRQEFDAACEQLAQGQVPLKPDREAGWRAFNGWRVNYDTVLIDLAGLTMAPYAPWSSDRSRLHKNTMSRSI